MQTGTQASLLRWFAPPELSRPDLQRHARALWMASWPFFAVVAVMLGIAVVVEPGTLARRSTTIAAVGALVTLLHTISRRGRPVLASWMLVVGLSVIVTQRAWITGGIHAPVAVFYALFIVMAGILIGARGGLVTAAVCLAGAVVLTAGTAFGWLTTRAGAGSALGGFVFVALSIGLALVLQQMVALRSQRESAVADNVQMIAHDMRSPIQIMLMRLDLLRQDVRRKNYTDIDGAIDGALLLQRMTTNLLDVSRLEAGRMPVERSVTDLSELARSVVATVSVVQPDRRIHVDAVGDVACSCDPELTRRIIDNLVSNAMKHTAVDGPVRVSVSGHHHAVRIAVIDAGPGVPPPVRARIFEPYSAMGLRTANGSASSGLGLAFCRLAAEAQGGSIRIDDGAPGRTAFIVELPR